MSMRVGVASAIVVAGLGIFIDSLPPGCRTAASQSCSTAHVTKPEKPAATPSPQSAPPAPAATVAAAPPAAAAEPGPTRQPAKTPLAEGLIAATFASLARVSGESVAAKEPSPSPQQPPAGLAEAPTTYVKTRVVQTHAVNADGTIAGLEAAPVAALPASPAKAAKSPEPEPVVTETAAVPAPQPAPPVPATLRRETAATKPVAAPRPAEPVANEMIVGGAGVNVRSGPTKSRGKVFTLAAGQRVTVLKEHRGWVFVADAKGRRGWIYSRYLYHAKK